MIPLDITDKFREEILSGRCKYLKDGIVTFTGISIETNTLETLIKFYNGGDHIATVTSKHSLNVGGVFDVHLTEGCMRIGMNE